MSEHPFSKISGIWKDDLNRRIGLLEKRYPELVTVLEPLIPQLQNLIVTIDHATWRVALPSAHDSSTWVLTGNVPQQDSELVERGIEIAWQRNAHLLMDVRPDYTGGTVRLERDIASDARRGIIIIEPDPLRLMAALSLCPIDWLVNSTQVFWSVGENVLDGLVGVLIKSCLYLIEDSDTALLFGNANDFRSPDKEFLASTRQLWERLKDARVEFIRARDAYAQRLAQPFDVSEMRIMSYTATGDYIHGSLIRTLLEGLESKGVAVRMLELQRGIAAQYQLVHEFAHFQPTSFLCANELAEDAMAGRHLTPDGWFEVTSMARVPIPSHRIVWITDDPEFYTNTLRPGDATQTHIFSADDAYLDCLRKHNPIDLAPLYHFPRFAIREPDFGTLEYDFVFLGIPPSAWERLPDLPLPVRDWLEEAVQYRIQSPFAELRGYLKETLLEVSERGIILQLARAWCASKGKGFGADSTCLAYLVDTLANARRRLDMILALLPFGLRVAGPPDWLRVLPAESQDAYLPWSPERDASELYRKTAINLNIHSLQLPTAANPRIMDIIAAGGFVLTDWLPVFEGEIFKEGIEIAAFRDLDEAGDLYRKYLENPNERESLILSAQERLRKEHLVSSRVEKMLNIFRKCPHAAPTATHFSDRHILRARQLQHNRLHDRISLFWNQYLDGLLKSIPAPESILLWTWDHIESLIDVNKRLAMQKNLVMEMRPYHLGYANPQLNSIWFGRLEDAPVQADSNDLILLLSGIEVLQHPSNLLSAAKRLLKNSGTIVLAGFSEIRTESQYHGVPLQRHALDETSILSWANKAELHRDSCHKLDNLFYAQLRCL